MTLYTKAGGSRHYCRDESIFLLQNTMISLLFQCRQNPFTVAVWIHSLESLYIETYSICIYCVTKTDKEKQKNKILIMTPQQENITSGYAMTNSQLSNKELCSVFDGSIVTHAEAITALFFFCRSYHRSWNCWVELLLNWTLSAAASSGGQ